MQNLALVQSINNLRKVGGSALSQYYIQALLVGGGGAGGNNLGGGGGAGGYLNTYSPLFSTVAYPIVVGNGATPSVSATSSTFESKVALPGGQGASGDTGSYDILLTGSATGGGDGACGGGGTGVSGGYQAIGFQGKNRGNGYWQGLAYQVSAGGGGGAYATGQNGLNLASGGGGDGLTWYDGNNYCGGGGGGGSLDYSIVIGPGATNYGGGNGGAEFEGSGDSALNNTGGGGGGGPYTGGGGVGGSGIVVIRYRGPQRGTGGTVISSVPITSLTHSGTQATAMSSINTGFSTSDLITISGATPSAYNGTFSILVVDGKTFQYTMLSTPASNATGTITAVSKYTTLVSLTHSGTTAIATTTQNYEFQNGDSVTISGATPSEYNGTFVIQNTSKNTFTYTMASDPGSDATGTIRATNGNGYVMHYFYSSGTYTA